MKNSKFKFTGKKEDKQTKDQFGKEQFSKMANREMMKRWGKSKNMGRGKT